ncbi:MAG: carbon-nitrogen hydrolase [Deltaproteobacteria bacterium]|nr:MAG: carbon-nitrogen hydrolase [Deltaproteobacteria bacterium]
MTSKINEKNVVLGLVQMTCEVDPKNNLEKAVLKIREAAKAGAQIISLQELFRSQYFCQENNDQYFSLAEAIPGQTTEILGNVAKECGVVIVASLFEKTSDHQYFNTACVVDADGKFLGKYRKIHIPDDLPNYYSELYYFKPGDMGFPVFETKFAKIGVQVCWDQWYPEGSRSLALQGAEIIFYPTAIGWPDTQRDQEIGSSEFDAWTTIQRSHAIANGVFVAVTNRTGKENHLSFWGGSFVADPLGRVLKKSSHDQEEILIVECNLEKIPEVRQDWPFLKCRRPDTYRNH